MIFGFLLVSLKLSTQFKHLTKEPTIWVRQKPAVAYGDPLWVLFVLERGLPAPSLSTAPWLDATAGSPAERRAETFCFSLQCA